VARGAAALELGLGPVSLAHLFAVLAHPPALLSDPQRRRADLRGSGVGLVIGEDLLARDIVQACVLVEMVAEVGEDPTSTGSRCSGNAGCSPWAVQNVCGQCSMDFFDPSL
jgi:hypothetical protein